MKMICNFKLKPLVCNGGAVRRMCEARFCAVVFAGFSLQCFCGTFGCHGQPRYFAGKNRKKYLRGGLSKGVAYLDNFDLIFTVDAETLVGWKGASFLIYGLGEYNIYRETEDQGLAIYGRFGYANADVNQLQYYLGAGLNYTGLISHRDQDQLGLAVATAFNGSKFEQAQSDAGTSVEDAEVNLELTYRACLTPWLVLQPDFQYIINPGTDPTLKNAFLAGLRWEVSL